jgi:tRNA nucleotidyltransferase/poly(A) polymerase
MANAVAYQGNLRFKNQYGFLFRPRIINFLSKILILSRDPLPLKRLGHEINILLKAYTITLYIAVLCAYALMFLRIFFIACC